MASCGARSAGEAAARLTLLQISDGKLLLPLDPVAALLHSPLMRWLILINSLALVLFAGAVAVMYEGALLYGLRTDRSDLPLVETDIDALSGPKHESQQPARLPVVSDETEENKPMAQTWPADLRLPLPSPRRQDVQVAEQDAPQKAPDSAELDAPELLRIATEGDFPPFNYRDENQLPAGFEIDLAEELCGRLARSCVIELFSWEELKPAIISGKADMMMAAIRIPNTPPAGIVFSDPYLVSKGRFVGPIDAQPTFFQSLSSFPHDNMHVAVQGGSAHAAFLTAAYPSLVLVLTPSFDDALSMVETGEVESAFGDNAAALYWLKDRACCRALEEPLAHPLYFGKGVGLAVREADSALLQQVNKALQQVIADGTYAILAERYFGKDIL